jgi:type I restriction enzyme, S subunit
MSTKLAGWETAHLRDVTKDISYGFTTSSGLNGSGPKLLRITDIQNGNVDWSSVPHCVNIPRASFLLQAGDIVIARTGATTGKSFLIEKLPCPTAFASYLIRARFAEEIEPKYTWAFMQSADYWSQIQIVSKGTAQPGANAQLLSQLQIPIAPLNEQRRIVAKIDSLSAKSQRACDQLDYIAPLVEKYKKAILASAFRGELTREWRRKQADVNCANDLIKRTEEPPQSRGGREATTDVRPGVAGLSINDPGSEPPAGWTWVALRRVARQETGHTPSRSHPEYWDGGIPWIGIPDAGNHHGQIIYQTLQTVSDQGLANSSARLLPAGTVCLSRTASVGYVTIMGRPMATSQDFATWTCSPALVPKYLLFALMAEGEDIRKFGEGSTHTTIYFPEIRALHICLAPLAEQHEIVARIEKAFAWIGRLASETTNARKLIDHLDKAVLAKAFQGELVPQDPSDEPASILLERIKCARSSVSADVRRKGQSNR